METFAKFFKKEAVSVIAAVAAAVSCLFVPPADYMSYVDLDMIAVLFCLMAVVAGFSENNVFKKLTQVVVKAAGNTRKLNFVLVITVFFISMLITNDVALIAFVPFTLMIYGKIGRLPIYTVVLQTVAANIGSTLTPFGNPQNLYLFSVSKMSPAEFFGITLPVTSVSFVMLLIMCCFVKKEDISIENDEPPVQVENIKYIRLYAILFVLAVLSVFDIIDTVSVFASVCVVVAIVQPVLFAKVDYGLLVTFLCFFIFVGNIKNIPQITDFMNSIIIGHEFESALAASQLISNVPSAVMLSAFTDNYRALVFGTNIGGLGTLIASLASLISYKHYACSEGAQTGKYVGVFTLVNLLFLGVLAAFVKLCLL